MQLRLENPGEFAKAIEIISELVSEVRIKVREFGLSISAMDPANVALVGLKIPKSAFADFEADETTLGVNLEDLKKVLKRVSPKSSLLLKKDENILEIQIEDRIRRSFRLNLIDIDSDDIEFSEKITNMEFSSKVEISSVDLISSIEDCAVVADSCVFEIANNKFIVSARGINSAKSEFSQDEAIISGEESKSKYSLEYLSKFMKASKFADKTKIDFAVNHPLKIIFKGPILELSFVLAPRVETD